MHVFRNTLRWRNHQACCWVKCFNKLFFEQLHLNLVSLRKSYKCYLRKWLYPLRIFLLKTIVQVDLIVKFDLLPVITVFKLLFTPIRLPTQPLFFITQEIVILHVFSYEPKLAFPFFFIISLGTFRLLHLVASHLYAYQCSEIWLI